MYARMHTCNWPRGGWRRRQEGARGTRERERQGEGEKGRRGKERNDGAARVPCEYNAEGTYRRFQRGIDGDLVAGNSPRLTPLSFSSPLHGGAARCPPLPPSRRRSRFFPAAFRHRTSPCPSLPSPPFRPAPQGGVIVSYTLPNNLPPSRPPGLPPPRPGRPPSRSVRGQTHVRYSPFSSHSSKET